MQEQSSTCASEKSIRALDAAICVQPVNIIRRFSPRLSGAFPREREREREREKQEAYMCEPMGRVNPSVFGVAVGASKGASKAESAGISSVVGM